MDRCVASTPLFKLTRNPTSEGFRQLTLMGRPLLRCWRAGTPGPGLPADVGSSAKGPCSQLPMRTPPQGVWGRRDQWMQGR